MPLPSTEILAHIQEGLILRVVAQMKPFLFAYATMNYKQIYDRLIEKRRRNPLSKSDGYCEKHHIVPKSEGGTDTKDNLVNLSAREHYMAHLLLAKIYDDYKMWSSVVYMRTNNRCHSRQFRFNSRLYQIARTSFAKRCSEHKRGKPSSRKGKHFGGLSEETKKKISLVLRGRPTWSKGRTFSDKYKRRLSESKKGRPSPMRGRKLSEETRRKMSESHKRIGTRPPLVVGKRWFNNGIVECRCLECPEGFVKGRLRKCRTTQT